MAKLTVQLVTWNGAKYIPFLFESLRAQTYTDWELQILDNASSDDTVAAIEKELALCQFPYTFEKSTTNTGFAGGHNYVYKKHTASAYVLLLNQDMYLMSDCFEHMVAFLDTHPKTASISPRLMRWHFNACQIRDGVCNVDGSHTDDVDALGLKVFRNRRVVEWYTKQSWHDIKVQRHLQFDAIPVFGVSGAFPMYRRSALQTVLLPGNMMLDTTYHSYKEDVDLAFRLRSAGFESFVLTHTVAYHDRSGAGPQSMSDTAAWKNKKTQSAWVRYHSYKNHLMTLYKNEYASNVVRDIPFIAWYEFKKFIWFLIFEPRVLGGLWECIKHIQELRTSRQAISRQRRVSARTIRTWWTTPHIRQESYGVIPVFMDRSGGEWFLLIREKRGHHWGFPKGRPEVCETPQQTALRELYEETGVESVTLDMNARPLIVDYVFDGRHTIVHKTTTLFIGMCMHMDTQLQKSEVADRVWLQYEDARRLLTHIQSKEMLDIAYTYLRNI